MNFAGRLKSAMDEQRMTQTELSALTGIGKSSISQYLSGKNIPKAAIMLKLVDALNTSVDYLEGKTGYSAADSSGTVKNVPVEEAAKMLGKSRQFVRVSLQRGIAPFGFAVKISGDKWSYHISSRKLNDYLGRAV